MQPFVIYGSTDKARQDYAESVSNENDYGFKTIDVKNFELYSRAYVTSGLDNRRTLFFFYDCEKLDVAKATKLLELVKGSNHIFMLSVPTSSDMNYVLQKGCLKKNLGDKMSDLTNALKNLMTVADRDSVRFAIENIDPNLLFHVMKKEAWQSPESLQALLDINRHIYKVKPDYIRSLLAYKLPKRAFNTNFQTKKQDTKLLKGIQVKLSKQYHLNSNETADLYSLIKMTKSDPNIELTKEERQFIGITDEVKVEPININKPKIDKLDVFF